MRPAATSSSSDGGKRLRLRKRRVSDAGEQQLPPHQATPSRVTAVAGHSKFGGAPPAPHALTLHEHWLLYSCLARAARDQTVLQLHTSASVLALTALSAVSAESPTSPLSTDAVTRPRAFRSARAARRVELRIGEARTAHGMTGHPHAHRTSTSMYMHNFNYNCLYVVVVCTRHHRT